MQSDPQMPGDEPARASRSSHRSSPKTQRGPKKRREPFYLKVRLNNKTRARLAEISWRTGMPWQEVASALLEELVPMQESRKNFEVWKQPLPPEHPAFIKHQANANKKNKKDQRLEIPISKTLDRELEQSARARSKAAVAAECLQRCCEKSIAGITDALRYLHQARKKAPNARDQVKQQLEHRPQFMAILTG